MSDLTPERRAELRGLAESAEWWADRLDAVTAIYTLAPCCEDGPDE